MTDKHEIDAEELRDSIYETQGAGDPLEPAFVTVVPAAKEKKSLFTSLKSAFSAGGREQVTEAFVGEASEELVAEIGPRPEMLPVIGHLPAGKQYLVCGAIVVSCLLGAAATGFYGARQIGFSGQRTAVASAVQTLSQTIAVSSQAALQGDSVAIGKMADSSRALSAQMNLLLDGDSSTGMSGMKGVQIREVISLDGSTKQLVDKSHSILEIAPALKQIDDIAAKASSGATDMFQLAVQLESVLSSSGAAKGQLAAVQHIKIAAERIRRNSVLILESRKPDQIAYSQLVSDFVSVKKAVEALGEGGGESGIAAVSDRDGKIFVSQLDSSVRSLAEVSSFVEKNGSAIVAKRQDQIALLKAASDALKDAGTVSEIMSAQATAYRGLQLVAGVFMLASILGVLLIGLVTTRLTKIEGWESRRKNKMNEKEIISFMEAIEPLEAGDLTQDFVSDLDAMEGITGVVRSSLNEAVNALRDAVQTVKQTAGDVSEIVSASVVNTKALEEANKRQSAEIDDVVVKAERLANAFTLVTEKTLRAAEMTKESKNASIEAAKVVAQTNERLKESLVQMQEVIKSVKFLGETSHEIGQFVEQIENITEMTVVIALNASLEAVKAGAAGAGFQVLAREVNRLAEQSNRLLINITTLVQRNRTETAAAIQVVEKATSSVVSGAGLAEDANEELRKISETSENVAQFVDDIRVQSEQQLVTTVEVRQAMGRLGVLSNDSRDAVAAVVDNVTQINSSMGKLEKTVGTFVTE
jgi:twitching motility protein PilJ